MNDFNEELQMKLERNKSIVENELIKRKNDIEAIKNVYNQLQDEEYKYMVKSSFRSLE